MADGTSGMGIGDSFANYESQIGAMTSAWDTSFEAKIQIDSLVLQNQLRNAMQDALKEGAKDAIQRIGY